MQKETLGHSHNISGHRDHIPVDTCCTHACLPLQAWVARHDSHPVDHYSVLQDTCAATFRRFSVVCSYHQGDLCRHHYSPSSVFLQNKFYSFRTPENIPCSLQLWVVVICLRSSVQLIANIVVIIKYIINMKIIHCVIFMTSYKQIFPLYTIDTTTKNQVVWVKVDSPYREPRWIYENLKSDIVSIFILRDTGNLTFPYHYDKFQYTLSITVMHETCFIPWYLIIHVANHLTI